MEFIKFMAVFCLFKDLKISGYILREAWSLIRCEYNLPADWKPKHIQQWMIVYCFLRSLPGCHQIYVTVLPRRGIWKDAAILQIYCTYQDIILQESEDCHKMTHISLDPLSEQISFQMCINTFHSIFVINNENRIVNTIWCLLDRASLW